MDWFDQLSYGPQLNDVVVGFFNGCATWLYGLSLNQRLVFVVLIVVALFVVNCLFKINSRIFVTVRRWLRRKFIPKNINLHLDREQRKHIEQNERCLNDFQGILLVLLFIGLVGFIGIKFMKINTINNKPVIGGNIIHRDFVKHYDENTLTIKQIEDCLKLKHYQDQYQAQVIELQTQLKERKLHLKKVEYPTKSDIQTFNVLIGQYRTLTKNLNANNLEWDGRCADKRYYLEDYNHSQPPSEH